MRNLAAGLLGLAIAASAAPSWSARVQGGAVDPIARRIAEALRCDDAPRAAPIILDLARRGYIAWKMDAGADGISCFYLRKPLRVPASQGRRMTLSAKAICVFDEHAPMRRYPGLFWRGPGTLPPQTLELYVKAKATDLQAWMQANGSAADAATVELRNATLGYLPSARTRLGGVDSALVCSLF